MDCLYIYSKGLYPESRNISVVLATPGTLCYSNTLKLQLCISSKDGNFVELRFDLTL